jgi:hypothetical protein
VHARNVQYVFLGMSNVDSRFRRSNSGVDLGCMDRRIVLVLVMCARSWDLASTYKGVVCLTRYSLTCNLETSTTKALGKVMFDAYVSRMGCV